jgi:hypothetical protein
VPEAAIDDARPMTAKTDVLSEMVTPVVDETLVAVQSFYPQGRWKSPGMGLMRLGRAVFGKSRLDDRLPLQSLMVVTPTRVLVFGTSTMTGAYAVTGQLAEWPRSAVTATKKRVELTTSGVNSSRLDSSSMKFLRLTLTTPDGELGADLPVGERASQQVAKELRAAESPA